MIANMFTAGLVMSSFALFQPRTRLITRIRLLMQPIVWLNLTLLLFTLSKLSMAFLSTRLLHALTLFLRQINCLALHTVLLLLISRPWIMFSGI
jgi:hypothetical protein